MKTKSISRVRRVVALLTGIVIGVWTSVQGAETADATHPTLPPSIAEGWQRALANLQKTVVPPATPFVWEIALPAMADRSGSLEGFEFRALLKNPGSLSDTPSLALLSPADRVVWLLASGDKGDPGQRSAAELALQLSARAWAFSEAENLLRATLGEQLSLPKLGVPGLFIGPPVAPATAPAQLPPLLEPLRLTGK